MCLSPPLPHTPDQRRRGALFSQRCPFTVARPSARLPSLLTISPAFEEREHANRASTGRGSDPPALFARGRAPPGQSRTTALPGAAATLPTFDREASSSSAPERARKGTSPGASTFMNGKSGARGSMVVETNPCHLGAVPANERIRRMRMRTLGSFLVVAGLFTVLGSRLALAQSSGNFSATGTAASCAIGTGGNFNGGTQVKVFSADISTSNANGVTLDIRPSLVTGLFTDTKISTTIPSATADVGIEVCVTVDGSGAGVLPSSCVVYDERFQQLSSNRSEERRVGKECRSRWAP